MSLPSGPACPRTAPAPPLPRLWPPSSQRSITSAPPVTAAAAAACGRRPRVAGILGENLVIPGFLTQSVHGFWVLNGVALLTVMSLFYSIILYMRWRKLI